MNRKPAKSNVSSKSKASTVAKPSVATPVIESEILVEKFQHCCTIQRFALVWLHEDFDPNNSNCRILVKELQTIIKKVDLFNDADNSIKFIKDIRDLDVYMIISNPNEKILVRANQVDQVKCIFIFNDRSSTEQSWSNKYSKVKGIYTSVELLCQSIKKTAKDLDTESKELRFLALQDIEKRGLDELDQSFMYTQLIKEILLELKYDDKCVQELVTYCNENRKNIKAKLHGLEEFEKGYTKKETAVWWYTKEIFTYHLVNWALREQEFDTIIRVGFFINDLHRHIAELHQEQVLQRQKEFIVYRGQGMSKERFEQLKDSVGGLLAFNNFLSTSEDKKVAERFLQTALQDGHPIGVKFIINIDPKISSAVYADIGAVSFYKKAEAEVLFSLGTVFRIGKIQQISIIPEVWTVQLSLTSNEDRELNTLMDRIRMEIKGSTPLYKLGALMIKVGQYNKAEEIYENLLKCTDDKIEKGNIYHQLGFTKYKQGNPKKALEFYRQALNIYQANFDIDHINLASVYINIGLAEDCLNNDSQVLVYYQKAQNIYEKNASSNGAVLATCYNNIASFYDQKQDYKQALIYFNKAYDIYKTQDTYSNHPDLATLQNNIGLVHLQTNEYQKAFDCFRQAVKIGKKGLPPDHAGLVEYKKNRETANNNLNKNE